MTCHLRVAAPAAALAFAAFAFAPEASRALTISAYYAAGYAQVASATLDDGSDGSGALLLEEYDSDAAAEPYEEGDAGAAASADILEDGAEGRLELETGALLSAGPGAGYADAFTDVFLDFDVTNLDETRSLTVVFDYGLFVSAEVTPGAGAPFTEDGGAIAFAELHLDGAGGEVLADEYFEVTSGFAPGAYGLFTDGIEDTVTLLLAPGATAILYLGAGGDALAFSEGTSEVPLPAALPLALAGLGLLGGLAVRRRRG